MERAHPNWEVLQSVAIRHLSTRGQGHSILEREMKPLRGFGIMGDGLERKDSPQLGFPPRCPRGMVVSSRACVGAESVSHPACLPHACPGRQSLPLSSHVCRGTGHSCTPQPCPSPYSWAEELFSSLSPQKADRGCLSALTSPGTEACRSEGRSKPEG